jgi:hypothetical protein
MNERRSSRAGDSVLNDSRNSRVAWKVGSHKYDSGVFGSRSKLDRYVLPTPESEAGNCGGFGDRRLLANEAIQGAAFNGKG